MSGEAAGAVTSAAPATTQTTPGTGNPGMSNPGTTLGGPDWTNGLSQDLRGYVENKGFKDPSSLADSYRNLEKLLSAPKERLLRLPDKEDAPEWGDVYNRMGRPGSADEYDIKPPQGETNDTFAKWARDNFHELGLSKKQAQGLANRWNDYVNNGQKSSQESMVAQVAAEEAGLKKEWGMAFDQNVGLAKRAAATFGVTSEVLDKMESSMGFGGVMRFMHSLGAKLGEDTFVGGGNQGGGGFGVMSPAAALNRLAELRKDHGFIKRYAAGDIAAKDEMNKLHRFAYPDEV